MKFLIFFMLSLLSIAPAHGNEDLFCLQQNIYFEAGNQPSMGQTAVAWVTINRVKSSNYPNSICDVVWQKNQFSWTSDGKSDRPPKNAIDRKIWDRAGLVARLTIEWWELGNDGPIDGSVMFHADYVNPYWAEHYEKVVKLGNHIFYKERES